MISFGACPGNRSFFRTSWQLRVKLIVAPGSRVTCAAAVRCNEPAGHLATEVIANRSRSHAGRDSAQPRGQDRTGELAPTTHRSSTSSSFHSAEKNSPTRFCPCSSAQRGCGRRRCHGTGSRLGEPLRLQYHPGNPILRRACTGTSRWSKVTTMSGWRASGVRTAFHIPCAGFLENCLGGIRHPSGSRWLPPALGKPACACAIHL